MAFFLSFSFFMNERFANTNEAEKRKLQIAKKNIFFDPFEQKLGQHDLCEPLLSFLPFFTAKGKLCVAAGTSFLATGDPFFYCCWIISSDRPKRRFAETAKTETPTENLSKQPNRKGQNSYKGNYAKCL